MKKVLKKICLVAIIILATTITVFASGCGRTNDSFTNVGLEINYVQKQFLKISKCKVEK